MKKVSLKFGQSKVNTITIAKGVKKLSNSKKDDKGNYLQVIDKDGNKVWDVEPIKEKLLTKFSLTTTEIELNDNIIHSVYELMSGVIEGVKFAVFNNGKFLANDGVNSFDVKRSFELSVIIDGIELKIENISTAMGTLKGVNNFKQYETLCLNIVSIISYHVNEGKLLTNVKGDTFKTLAY